MPKRTSIPIVVVRALLEDVHTMVCTGFADPNHKIIAEYQSRMTKGLEIWSKRKETT